MSEELYKMMIMNIKMNLKMRTNMKIKSRSRIPVQLSPTHSLALC